MRITRYDKYGKTVTNVPENKKTNELTINVNTEKDDAGKGQKTAATEAAQPKYSVPKADYKTWKEYLSKYDTTAWKKNVPQADTEAWKKNVPQADTEASKKNVPQVDAEAWKKNVPKVDTEAWKKNVPKVDTEAWKKNIPQVDTEAWKKNVPQVDTEAWKKNVPQADTEAWKKNVPQVDTEAWKKNVPQVDPDQWKKYLSGAGADTVKYNPKSGFKITLPPCDKFNLFGMAEVAAPQGVTISIRLPFPMNDAILNKLGDQIRGMGGDVELTDKNR